MKRQCRGYGGSSAITITPDKVLGILRQDGLIKAYNREIMRRKKI